MNDNNINNNMYNVPNNMNNVNNNIPEQNTKKFNTTLGIIGVVAGSFAIFMIFNIISIYLLANGNTNESISRMVSIFKMIIPMLVLVIGIPSIIIYGNTVNKKK